MKEYRAGIDIGSTTVKLVILDDKDQILYGEYKRHSAHIQETLTELLKEAHHLLGNSKLRVKITGSGSMNLGKALEIEFVQVQHMQLLLRLRFVSIIRRKKRLANMRFSWAIFLL